jgi:putative transposase
MAPGVFHVYGHCVWAAKELFRDDADRMTFLRELARASAKAHWTCIGYCLMRSHYHLVLDVDEGALPVGMHSLNFRYACSFNMRYAMKGHVFGARYDSRRIQGATQLLRTYRYVMRNPLEVGLCVDPEDWPWSSHAGTVGLVEPVSFVDPSSVLEAIGGETADAARSLLRDYVALS